MTKRLLDRLSDVSKLHRRAAFVDVNKIIKKHQGSDVFLSLVDRRFSCRAFSNRPVSATKIQSVLEAGRMAPSAKNLQPTRVWVVSSDEALAKLRTIHTCYDAPVVLIVAADPAKAWVRDCDGKNSADVDAAIVGTHMMMAAADQDLDTVWIGSFDPARLKALFPELGTYEPVLLLPVGHAAAQGQPSERHSERQDPAVFATEL